jgi:hypothetical protein
MPNWSKGTTMPTPLSASCTIAARASPRTAHTSSMATRKAGAKRVASSMAAWCWASEATFASKSRAAASAALIQAVTLTKKSMMSSWIQIESAKAIHSRCG